MKLSDKVLRVKQELKNILSHDDEPVVEVLKRIEEVRTYIEEEVALLTERRRKKTTFEKVKAYFLG